MDARTSEWMPCLAWRWRRLPGGRVYEFELRPDATWSDGLPVTAEDVKFSFDVLFNDAFPTAHMRPYYEGLSRVEIVGPRTVRFHAKNSYFGNFISSAGLPILPKHFYSDPKKGPHIHRDILGSGPYRLESWQRGAQIALVANPRWWGRRDPLWKNAYKPGRVVFKFVADDGIAAEMLKRGDLDFMSLTPDFFRQRTRDAAWGRIAFKRKVSNLYPKDSRFIAWNLRHPIFRDVRVRRALAYLVDRPTMIQKFTYGVTVPATGPWYRQSDFADPSVPAIPYDPPRALRLLREAGWTDTDGDGVLDKVIDGHRIPLRFTIHTATKASERYLTMLQQDARPAGVDIRIKFLDWNALGGILEDRKFDAVDSAWGGGLVDFDPKPMWHSASDYRGGMNVMGYHDARVDALIERARHEPDRRRRTPLMREIYRRVADAQPCLFLFNDDALLYAYSARVGRPADTYAYDVGTKYWWVKPEAAR
jgi:peptide/nickel transport system substrate-binding protein/microcin C transport system substrate-binding protein